MSQSRADSEKNEILSNVAVKKMFKKLNKKIWITPTDLLIKGAKYKLYYLVGPLSEKIYFYKKIKKQKHKNRFDFIIWLFQTYHHVIK